MHGASPARSMRRHHRLIDRFEGKPLNAPNDVVVSSDGAIWFTDPVFGNLGNYEGHRVQSNCRRRFIGWTRSGRATVVGDGFGGPDGLPSRRMSKPVYRGYRSDHPSDRRIFAFLT